MAVLGREDGGKSEIADGSAVWVDDVGCMGWKWLTGGWKIVANYANGSICGIYGNSTGN